MQTIAYGSRKIPVINRLWNTTKERKPYKKTYKLKHGESWFDAEETSNQWETYVATSEGIYEPVGALVARELIDEGAIIAGFLEMWGGVVFVDQNLICQKIDGEIASILDQVRDLNQGKLGGFPDVIGLFTDGRIALREIKNLDTKDKLGKKQHDLADLLFTKFKDRIDLKVVEWSSPIKSEKM